MTLYRTLVIGVCWMLFTPIFAHIYPVDLDTRIDQATQITIAQVVDKHSYWNEEGDAIYTSYKMKVICYAKNPSNAYFFDLILPGGIVETDIERHYPYVNLLVGHEYMVAMKEVAGTKLNRNHLARSSSPKFEPYSFIQGILPSSNGVYQDYFTKEGMHEISLLTKIYSKTLTKAKKPDGSDFEFRTTFTKQDGDIDNDGVLDLYDLDPSDPNSDSDGDGISDIGETNGDGIYHPDTDSNPLSACDPTPQASNCLGVDTDGDGFFGNYPKNNDLYDPDDRNVCSPNNSITIPIQKDNWINEVSPFGNHGKSSTLYIDETSNQNKRALLQFDLEQAQGSTALNATLHLYIEGVNQGAIVDFYRVLQEWEEGEKNQEIGAGNWSQATANLDWQPGGNVDPSILHSEPVNQLGWIDIELPVSLIQEWLDQPATNFGLLLTNSIPLPNAILGIRSKESSHPPYLSLTLDASSCNGERANTETTTLNRVGIVLKNGNGTATNNFVAGTTDEENELLIEGSGFGNTPGSLAFPNADNGGLNSILIEYGTDIVSWTDSQIRVKIPKNAGSGTLNILNGVGTPIGSTDINISWALNPLYHDFRQFDDFTRQRVNMIDANESGGYTLLLSSINGFSTNTEAIASLGRALGKWQCASSVNVELDHAPVDLPIANDGYCVVDFSFDLPAGVLAITSSRYKGSGNSNCSEFRTLWRLKEFDIEFAHPSTLPNSITWNFGEGNPTAVQFDLESIALHELGHAHGLAHVVDEASVMHFSIANGNMKRELNAQEIDGAAHKMSYSTTSNCVTSHAPMIAYVGNDNCGDVTATPSIAPNAMKVKVLLEGFYNTNDNQLSTTLATSGLLPTTQPYSAAPFHYEGTESVATIPPNVVDWILLELRSPTNMETIVYQGAYLLRQDGQVLTPDGSEVLPFLDVSGEYLIAIHHLNHIPIVSSLPHTISLDASLYDFSTTVQSAMGDGQLKDLQGRSFMNSGDFDSNGLINNADYNLWKSNSANINIYSPADADGNGIINSVDYNFWKVNRSKIGLITR